MQYRPARDARMTYLDNVGWRLRLIRQRKSWNVDRLTAAVALAHLGQDMRTSQIERELVPVMGEETFNERLSALAGIRFLVKDDEGVTDVEHTWAARGWREAHDYLWATWDYPFEDYSSNGQARDRLRMREYEASEPDVVRYMTPKGDSVTQLPDIQSALDRLTRRASTNADSLMTVLLDVLSVAALPLEWRASRTDGAAHMLRTSPSGGARHPSEVYLLAHDVPAMPRGIYQASVGDQSLQFLANLPGEGELRKHMPGAFRLSAPPRAIFVIASHFDRNMYRYREPRTLRTVYLDAGHLGGLIESLCDTDGTVSHGHHGFSDTFVAGLIRSESLAVEAPTYLVSVGLGSERYPGTVQVGKSGLKS